MGKEIIRFGDIEIKRLNFHCNKNTIFQKDVDIDSILISNKISSGGKIYKHFIGCMDCKISHYK